MLRKKALVFWVIVAVVCAAYAASSVLAQMSGPPGGPGGPVGPPQPPMLMIKAGGEGLFMLMAGRLTKLDPVTLKQVGVLQLIDKPPASEGRDVPPGPPLHGQMLIAGGTNGATEKVLVLIADRIFIVDAASFEVLARVVLPRPPAPPDARDGQAPPRPPMGPPAQPMALELHGQMLYVLRGPQIIAVNITSGTVTAQATLRKPEG